MYTIYNLFKKILMTVISGRQEMFLREWDYINSIQRHHRINYMSLWERMGDIKFWLWDIRDQYFYEFKKSNKPHFGRQSK